MKVSSHSTPDSLNIIELQRRFDFSSPDFPGVGSCIAGDIDLVAVSRHGITVNTIHSYAAQVGEKVAI